MLRLRFVRSLILAAALAVSQINVIPALARELDFRLILHAAQLAEQVYEGESEIFGKYPGRKAWVATPGKTDVQYVLLHNKKRRIQAIAIRGTVNDRNWDLDMDTRGAKDDKTGIQMHRGFKTIAETIYTDIKPRLRRDYTTYVTGHSLGGAVAGIIGSYLVDDNFRVARVITFGQPKFTNVAGAQAYRRLPLLRIVNQNDAVALWPDQTKGGAEKFAHIGPAVNLLSGPHYTYIPANKALQLSQGSLRRFFTQISVPDHKMARYIRNLSQKQSGTKEVSFEDRETYVVREKLGTGVEPDKPIQRRQNFNKHP